MKIFLPLAAFSISTAAFAGDMPWRWEDAAQGPQSVEIDLIRGDVRIERVDGDRAEITALVSDSPDAPRLDVRQTAQGLKVRDLYPQLSGTRPMRECLPPIDERGDYWHSAARVRMVVRVPRATLVKVSIAENSNSVPTP